jgi:hypothetical protein
MLDGISSATQARVTALRTQEAHSDPATDPTSDPSATTTAHVAGTPQTANPALTAATAAAASALALVDADAARVNDGKMSPEQYNRDDQSLLTKVEKEFGLTYAQLMSQVCYLTPPVAVAEAAITAAHPKDPEWIAVAKAAGIVFQVNQAQGTNAKIAVLAKNLPVGVDPSIKRLVLGDNGVQTVVGQYVDNAAAQVAQQYSTNLGGAASPGAAADTLQQLITHLPQGSYSSQLAALIINKSMPTIRSIVQQLPLTGVMVERAPTSLNGQPNSPELNTNEAENKAIFQDLSQAVEAAAAGEDSNTGTYDTPQITAAVTGVAKAIATDPYALGVLDPALTDAVGHGYATLALATAQQVEALKPGDLPAGFAANTQFTAGFTGWKSTQLRYLLGDITTGIQDFQAYLSTAMKSLQQSLGPIAAQSIFATVLNPAQSGGGIDAMLDGIKGAGVNSVPGLKQGIDAALKNITALGYQITRTDDAVKFYQHSLGGIPGYTDVQKADAGLVTSPNGVAFQFWSPQARTTIIEQAFQQMLASAGPAGSGVKGPQLFSTGSQTFGDLTEFLVEEVLRNAKGGHGSLTLLDTEGNKIFLDPDRVGHTPAAFAWLLGGGLQAALTAWLAANSHPGGPLSDERKAVTLMVVAGFSGLHTGQAVLAGVRWLAQFNNVAKSLRGATSSSGSGAIDKFIDGINNASDWLASYAKAAQSANSGHVLIGGFLDNISRLTVEPTVGLIRGLTVLMGIASVADAAGLTYEVTGLQQYPGGNVETGVNAGAHFTNLVSDITLLRLQVRGWAQQALGKTLLGNPTSSAAFKQAIYDAFRDPTGGKTSAALRTAAKAWSKDNPAYSPDWVAAALNAEPGTASEAQAAAAWAKQLIKLNTGTAKTLAYFQKQYFGDESFGKFILRTSYLNKPFQASLDDLQKTVVTRFLKGFSTTGERSLATSWALENPTYVTDLAGKLATSGYLDGYGNTVNSLVKILNPKTWGDWAKAGADTWTEVFSAVGDELALNGFSVSGLGSAIAGALTDGGGAAAAEGSVDAVAGLSNPIGWATNLLYIGTTLTTTFYNQYETIQGAQNNTYDFLRGAGVDAAPAAVLKSYGYFDGSAAAAGFVAAYKLAGGNPGDFVKYVNLLPVGMLSRALGAFGELSGYNNTNATLPATSSQDYWMLPVDPTKQATRGVTYNTSQQRWEDKELNVHFQDGSWNVNDNSGDYYDPSNQTYYLYSDVTGTSLPIHLPPASVAGIEAWFASNNVTPPPSAHS